MTFDEHGGGCCGIGHLWGLGEFTDSRKKEFDRLVKYNRRDEPEVVEYGWDDDDEDVTDSKDSCVCIEVVIAEGQCGWKEWTKHVLYAGFRQSARFRNRNSDNICTIYHLYLDPQE